MIHTTYSPAIYGIRWVTHVRDDVAPILQYALRPINGGELHWFTVQTAVDARSPTEQQPKGNSNA